ncbi:MAG: glycosyltransferase family 1 protein, partial [Acidimicrobiales bacterium]
ALLDTEWAAACRDRAAEVARGYMWPMVAQPLLARCAAPRRAPDLLEGSTRRRFGGIPTAPRPRDGVRADLLRARDTLRQEGPASVVRRIATRLRRRP